MKKYTVKYYNRSTGFGRSEEYDKIHQVEYAIEGIKNDFMATVEVYDNELDDFIYLKKSRSYEAEVDFITKGFRDLRTKNRMKLDY